MIITVTVGVTVYFPLQFNVTIGVTVLVTVLVTNNVTELSNCVFISSITITVTIKCNDWYNGPCNGVKSNDSIFFKYGHIQYSGVRCCLSLRLIISSEYL